jgi:hypothetical protein
MAKLARQIGGGLDAVIAMTGHKDIKLADNYSKCDKDDQREFSEKIMEHIRKSRSNAIKNRLVLKMLFQYLSIKMVHKDNKSRTEVGFGRIGAKSPTLTSRISDS